MYWTIFEEEMSEKPKFNIFLTEVIKKFLKFTRKSFLMGTKKFIFQTVRFDVERTICMFIYHAEDNLIDFYMVLLVTHTHNS